MDSYLLRRKTESQTMAESACATALCKRSHVGGFQTQKKEISGNLRFSSRSSLIWKRYLTDWRWGRLSTTAHHAGSTGSRKELKAFVSYKFLLFHIYKGGTSSEREQEENGRRTAISSTCLCRFPSARHRDHPVPKRVVVHVPPLSLFF